ncbi:MAG TPA: cytochrome C oxidase subunit IV family protein [Nitrospirota bacterium]|nr:cytochrome C oxidase subunit IV family protein [Nitrospirota bacterium]
MEQHEPKQHTLVPDRVFVTVWIALLILTGVTIKAAQMHMGEWSMLANLLIASTKASLVLWFFMHLKYEKKLFKVLLLVPIVTITVIIGLTFFDIWYR